MASVSYVIIVPYGFRVHRFDGVALIPVLIIMIVVKIPMIYNVYKYKPNNCSSQELDDNNQRR